MFPDIIKKYKNQILTIFLAFLFGCAPQQKTFSIDDVEKQRTEYLDGKLKSVVAPVLLKVTVATTENSDVLAVASLG